MLKRIIVVIAVVAAGGQPIEALPNTTLNTQIAIGRQYHSQGIYTAFSVDEAGQNIDLNWDGDTNDYLVMVYNAQTDSSVLLGWPVDPGDKYAIYGNYLAFHVLEADANAQDLNGDGDTLDKVCHYVDLTTNSVTNTGLAAVTLYPGHSGRTAMHTDRLVVAVSEADQGNTDLNADGDTTDAIMHVVRMSTGNIRNVQLPVEFENDRFAMNGEHVVWTVSETEQGNTDLNGDGDAIDDVLHVHKMPGGVTTNMGLAGEIGVGSYAIGFKPLHLPSNYAAFVVAEADQSADLSNDGDQLDEVVHAIDLVALVVHNTQTATTSNSRVMPTGGSKIVFSAYEQGTDLDGDGTPFDLTVAAIVDAATGTTTFLPNDFIPHTFEGNKVYGQSHESSNGPVGGIDQNADGDLDDEMPVVLNLQTNTFTAMPLAVRSLGSLCMGKGDWVVFDASEQSNGAADANGDGDTNDVIFHTHNLATGVTHSTGLVTSIALPTHNTVVFSGSVVAFYVKETVDLNGDGDSNDQMPVLLDMSTGATYIPNVPLSPPSYRRSFTYAAGVLHFGTEESDHGADLNGDGDLDDYVLQRVR